MTGGFITGVLGQIKWSYYVAASVKGYKARRTQDGRWMLSATVVERDAFKLSQKPLMFVAAYKKPCAICTEGKLKCEQHPREWGQWYWPITDYELKDGEALTATLGPPI